jgi:hypothetical protein
MKRKCPNCGEIKSENTLTLTNTSIIREWFCVSCGTIKLKNSIPLKTTSNKYRYLSIGRKQIQMHRWVYEEHNKTKLKSFQPVHHADCIKSNNLPGNLIVPKKHGPDKHYSHHIFIIKTLQDKIKKLEANIKGYEEKNIQV